MKTKPIIILCGTVISLGFVVYSSRQGGTNNTDAVVDGHNENTLLAGKNIAPTNDEVVSDRLKVILENRRSTHPRLTRTASSKKDEAILLKAYKITTNLQDRFSLTWALAEIGGDATVAAFEHALTDEFAGQPLRRTAGPTGFDPSSSLHDTVYALGFLAITNDRAFALVQKGVDPFFWQKNVRWHSDYGADNYGILACRSLQAIGISGRAEASVLLEKLKDTRLTNDTDPGPYRRTLWDGLMDAAFYNWLIHAEGREAFERHFSSDSDVFDHDGRFRKWQASEDGKKWGAWAAKFRQKAQAEMEERERAQPK